MSDAPILDTHAWLWWLDGTGALTAKERRELESLVDVGTRPFVCSISLWEMACLVDLGRVALREGFDAWIEIAAAPGTVVVVDVVADIAKELMRLPRSFHRDPADRLIVASARALGLPVLTHDTGIRRSGLVRLWRPP